MQYLTLQWQLIAAAFAAYWREEVAPPRSAAQLAPIRYHGDPREVYLA
jgi:hypothetical protein